MSKICFITDMEEGHILPSFGFAHSLKSRGHEILYASMIDNEPLIKEQGFGFQPMMENIYFKGFRQQFKKSNLNPGKILPDHLNARQRHITQTINGAYDHLIKHSGIDLFIMSFYLSVDILLLHYKYNLRPVVINPVVREAACPLPQLCMEILNDLSLEEQYLLVDFFEELGLNISSFQEMVKPLGRLEELILCPGELEFDQNLATSNVHYIEPSLRTKTAFVNVNEMYQLPPGKKIIYAAMGSQAIRHGVNCDIFFGKVINIMRSPEFQGMHLILSVGQEYDQSRLQNVPENVTVLRWVSQIEILQVASVAIIHGGLGSVKECIVYGVPMVIFPQGYDQPYNGRRIAHHNLGFTNDIDAVTEEELKYYLLSTLYDEKIRNAIRQMQQVFRQKEADRPGAAIIERLLERRQGAILHGSL